MRAVELKLEANFDDFPIDEFFRWANLVVNSVPLYEVPEPRDLGL